MLNELQDKSREIQDLIKKSTGKELSAYAKLTMLSAEIGELADDLIALEGDRVEDKSYKNTDELAKEIVDVIYNALTIANHYDIKLDDYFIPRLEKIKAKF